MSLSVRIRLILFVLLAVVGIGDVGIRYLGLGERFLGPDVVIAAELPETGGLYTGGLVTVRGVPAGEIGAMTPTPEGVRLELRLDHDVQIPEDAPFSVHNGSAVGEQYLDFLPTGDQGPYLSEGDVVTAGREALPIDEGDLLLDLDRFVAGVDTDDLQTVVSELGTMFADTGGSLQAMLDGADELLADATDSSPETISLLESSEIVLGTQQRNAADIVRFADGIDRIARALRDGDRDIARLLTETPRSLRPVRRLLSDLRPTMPLLLSNLVATNRTVAIQLPAVEQLLVTLPVMISGAFSGTTPDGYGYVGFQFSQAPVCQEGFVPRSEWRPGVDTSEPEDQEMYDRAYCAEPFPITPRGSKYAPRPSGGAARVAPYEDGSTVVTHTEGRIRLLPAAGGGAAPDGDWTYVLLGPTEEKQ